METVRHTKPDGIWLFDYNMLLAQDDCAELPVWISKRDLQIILQACVGIDKFRTRVFTDVQGQIYTIATPLQFETFQGWVSDMFNNLGGYVMCNDLINQQNLLLQSIADTLARMADCGCNEASTTTNGTGGSRGAGTTQRNPPGYNQADTPDIPPDGFDDMATYRTHKCNAAWEIIGQIQIDIQSMSVLNLIGVGVTAFATTLVATLITPIPFDELLAIAFAVITGAVTASYMLEVSSAIGAEWQDLTCELYNAEDVEDARARLYDALSAIVDGMITIPELVKPYVKQMLNPFLNNDNLARLFEDVPIRTTGTDCSSCGPEYWWECVVGDLISYDLQEVRLAAIEGSYGEYIMVLAVSVADDFTTTLLSGTVTSPGESPQCVTTIFDSPMGCSVNCYMYDDTREQYPTGVFGAINDAYVIMYRSELPFSVLFERV